MGLVICAETPLQLATALVLADDLGIDRRNLVVVAADLGQAPESRPKWYEAKKLRAAIDGPVVIIDLNQRVRPRHPVMLRGQHLRVVHLQISQSMSQVEHLMVPAADRAPWSTLCQRLKAPQVTEIWTSPRDQIVGRPGRGLFWCKPHQVAVLNLLGAPVPAAISVPAEPVVVQLRQLQGEQTPEIPSTRNLAEALLFAHGNVEVELLSTDPWDQAIFAAVLHEEYESWLEPLLVVAPASRYSFGKQVKTWFAVIGRTDPNRPVVLSKTFGEAMLWSAKQRKVRHLEVGTNIVQRWRRRIRRVQRRDPATIARLRNAISRRLKW